MKSFQYYVKSKLKLILMLIICIAIFAGSKAAYSKVRESVNFIDNDVVMYKEIDKVTDLVRSGALAEAVEEKVQINL